VILAGELHVGPMQPAGRLIGANPIAALTNRGERVAVVSMWDVAWSTHGAGRAVLVWVGGDESIRLLTPHEHLGSWLAQTFNRHFPEFEGLPEIAAPIGCRITEWLIQPDRARLDVVASDGLRVTTSISRPVQTRPGYAHTFQLGDVPWMLTNLLTFCADAVIMVGGKPVEGNPTISQDGPFTRSTAFIATHETWIRHSAAESTTS
jgi:hypothetical protein